MTVTAAPLRISDKPGHDTVTVEVSADVTIGNARVIFNGERRDEPPIANLGVVCGLNRCGAPGVMPLAAAGLELEFDYADTGGPPDGTYPLTVHVRSELEWS